eukprot:g12124.t1 g12124   contig6:1269722-1269979(+)
MKFSPAVTLALAAAFPTAAAFVTCPSRHAATIGTSSTRLNVQLEAPKKDLPKIEKLKIASNYLREPLGEQLATEEIGISKMRIKS